MKAEGVPNEDYDKSYNYYATVRETGDNPIK